MMMMIKTELSLSFMCLLMCTVCQYTLSKMYEHDLQLSKNGYIQVCPDLLQSLIKSVQEIFLSEFLFRLCVSTFENQVCLWCFLLVFFQFLISNTLSKY